MEPTLRSGDALVVLYGARVRPGDLVIVRLPGGGLAVKRAVRADGERWWVEGDAAQASTDSRSYGPLKVRARVIARYARLGGDRAEGRP